MILFYTKSCAVSGQGAPPCTRRRSDSFQALHPLPRLGGRRLHYHADHAIGGEFEAHSGGPIAKLCRERLGKDGDANRPLPGTPQSSRSSRGVDAILRAKYSGFLLVSYE